MPRQVTDVDRLRDYIRGVMERADHHAEHVNEVALALVGAIIWRKDDDPIEVRVHDGEMKNVLWFKVEGERYAFSYNHRTNSIELRQGTTHGAVMGSFTNATPCSEVRRAFEQL